MSGDVRPGRTRRAAWIPALLFLFLLPHVFLRAPRAAEWPLVDRASVPAAPLPALPGARVQRGAEAWPHLLPGPDKVLPGDEYWSSKFWRRAVWGTVLELGEYQGDLVVGGTFPFVGNTPACNVARWDGMAWHALGVGPRWEPDSVMSGLVSALIEFDGKLIAGGLFNRAGTDTVAGIRAAYWDGEAWHRMDQGGTTGQVYSLALYRGRGRWPGSLNPTRPPVPGTAAPARVYHWPVCVSHQRHSHGGISCAS